jgi:DNA-binding NarL/FixJ family response regulator
MWRVIAYTDEPIVELGLQALLSADAEFSLICICRSRAEFLHAAERHHPQVLVYDLAADLNLDMAAGLRKVASKASLVVWGRDVPAELAHRAIGMGVRGLVSLAAQPDSFRDCLRAAACGELWLESSLSMRLLNSPPVHLSRRQGQLVGLLVQGLKNKEIAASLGISEGTVKAYLTTLFEKVGAKDRFELALYGLKNWRHLHGGGLEDEARAPGRSRVARRAAQKPAAAGRRPRARKALADKMFVFKTPGADWAS